MKLTILSVDATPEELDSSSVLSELLERISDPSTDGAKNPHQIAPQDVDADDDAARRSAAEAAETPAPPAPETIPGVAAEGQAVVRGLLDKNPAGHLFEQFLAETSAWPQVGVHGIKPRGHAAGTALDYGRYLRLRKYGSPFGGFAYVYAVDGLVNLRLAFETDSELAEVAPDAWRLSTGHREYRVSIRVADDGTLQQALALARLAYDAT